MTLIYVAIGYCLGVLFPFPYLSGYIHSAWNRLGDYLSSGSKGSTDTVKPQRAPTAETVTTDVSTVQTGTSSPIVVPTIPVAPPGKDDPMKIG